MLNSQSINENVISLARPADLLFLELLSTHTEHKTNPNPTARQMARREPILEMPRTNPVSEAACDTDDSTKEEAVLPKLPAGPWRSLGGCFDYTCWADRERFLELDRAIACDSGGDGEELQVA